MKRKAVTMNLVGGGGGGEDCEWWMEWCYHSNEICLYY